MPMGKPVPAQDPYAKLAPISTAEAVSVNKTNQAEAADGYKGGSK